MKKSFSVYAAVVVLISFSSCSNKEGLKISGETNYSKNQNESMVTSLSANYKLKIEKLSNNNFHVFLTGTVNPDYDHFLNEFKTNAFTGLHIEF